MDGDCILVAFTSIYFLKNQFDFWGGFFLVRSFWPFKKNERVRHGWRVIFTGRYNMMDIYRDVLALINKKGAF